jgi:hypothetical protein
VFFRVSCHRNGSNFHNLPQPIRELKRQEVARHRDGVFEADPAPDRPSELWFRSHRISMLYASTFRR